MRAKLKKHQVQPSLEDDLGQDYEGLDATVEEIERLKLDDGVRLHESVKVELETYARETMNPIVEPFVLVIARDTTHASQLMQLIQSEGFFEGRYAAKVIQVDSSKTGVEEDEMVERLLKVEHTDEPTEPEVLAKRDVAVTWCKQASDHARSYGGKPWTYLLIPHDVIAENMTLEGLAKRH